MSEFKLDTSGVVPACAPTADPSILGPCGFHDLTPFSQGYVEALFAELRGPSAMDDSCVCKCGRRHVWTPSGGMCRSCGQPLPGGRLGGFSDLSPEALGMILADCERFLAERTEPRWTENPKWLAAERGKDFWSSRQADVRVHFPPLTISLNDDGKIVLAVAK